ncbi:uncharacterized protein LOC117101965 isoform X4 [Anneissia japonica]|uniref:uncharacterized protein LOC117101965 isoform X4 n=1 Tax=Anneissia japonica TaxID=1529436 RepID=UPI001425AC93|nr:uncharacterized protein LOC117101965 isoform X4 [Anneissia japonica]
MPRNYNNYYGNYYNGRQQQQRRNWRGRYNDGDLEWDNYDLGSGGQRNLKDRRYYNRNNQNNFHRYSNFPSTADSELEWDDYDLRQKQEECLEGLESILPLLNELNRAPSFQGHFNSRGRYNTRSQSYGRYQDDIRMRRFKINQDFFVLSGYNSSLSYNLDTNYNRGSRHINNRRNGYDRSNSYDRYGRKKDGRPDQQFYNARERISRPSNLPIDDWLMSNTFSLMQNKRRLTDVNLYTISPQDLEPLDSSQNGSLADLSDLSLCKCGIGNNAFNDYQTTQIHARNRLCDHYSPYTRSPENYGCECFQLCNNLNSNHQICEECQDRYNLIRNNPHSIAYLQHIQQYSLYWEKDTDSDNCKMFKFNKRRKKEGLEKLSSELFGPRPSNRHKGGSCSSSVSRDSYDDDEDFNNKSCCTCVELDPNLHTVEFHSNTSHKTLCHHCYGNEDNRVQVDLELTNNFHKGDSGSPDGMGASIGDGNNLVMGSSGDSALSTSVSEAVCRCLRQRPESFYSTCTISDDDLGLDFKQDGEDFSVGRSADGDDDTLSLASVASLADDNKDGSGKKAKAKKAKKRKRKGGEKGEEATENDDDNAGNKNKKVAPNYFVAIQVSNPKIQRSLRQVQNHVLNVDEKLKDAMIPIPTMHLTIMVMHLANEEEIEKAKKALAASHKELSVKFGEEKLLIHFQGLSHFNNQVMFARILDDNNTIEVLYQIAETVERCFKEHGISSTGERGFKPHLTVMKLSRAPSLRKKGVRRIKSEVYKEHSNKYFGGQVMRGLQLCSITKPKTGDGYYARLQEFYFGSYGELEEEDDGIDLIGDPVIESANSSQALEPLNELISDLKEQKTNTITKVTESVKKALETSGKEEDSTSEIVSESSLDRTADLTTSCDDMTSEEPQQHRLDTEIDSPSTKNVT